jgi:hypothetical protein
MGRSIQLHEPRPAGRCASSNKARQDGRHIGRKAEAIVSDHELDDGAIPKLQVKLTLRFPAKSLARIVPFICIVSNRRQGCRLQCRGNDWGRFNMLCLCDSSPQLFQTPELSIDVCFARRPPKQQIQRRKRIYLDNTSYLVTLALRE